MSKPTGGSKTKRHILAALLATVGAISLVYSQPSTASADPDVHDIEITIRDSAIELESTIEEYNATVSGIEELAERKTELEASSEPERSRIEQDSAELSNMAAALYRSSGVVTVSPILKARPGTLAERLTILNYFGHTQSARIDELTESLSRIAEVQAEIDELGQQRDTLAVQKRELAEVIDTATTELNGIRSTTNISSVSAHGVAPPPIPGGINGAASTAIEFAHGALGVPYLWGGMSPDGYDCSGLTAAAWGAAGKSLPHSAAGQYDVTAHVSRSELQPGDLIFYYDDIRHVALYVGDGKVIHAPTQGQNVQVAPMELGPIVAYGRVV